MNTNKNNYNVSTIASIMRLIVSVLLPFSSVLIVRGTFSAIKNSFSGDSIIYPIVGLIMVGICFGLTYWAKIVNEKKLFKFWLQYIKENNLEGIISTDLSVAVEVFNQCPTVYSLDYIIKLNPQVKQLPIEKVFKNSSDQTPSQPQNAPDRYASSAHSLTLQPATTAAQANYCVCAKCGTRSANDSKFCYACGSRIK